MWLLGYSGLNVLWQHMMSQLHDLLPTWVHLGLKKWVPRRWPASCPEQLSQGAKPVTIYVHEVSQWSLGDIWENHST